MGLTKAKNIVYPVFRPETESSAACGSPPIHLVTTPRTTRSSRRSGKVSFPKMMWRRSFGDLSLHRKRLWRLNTVLMFILPLMEGRKQLVIVPPVLMFHVPVLCPHWRHTL